MVDIKDIENQCQPDWRWPKITLKKAHLRNILIELKLLRKTIVKIEETFEAAENDAPSREKFASVHDYHAACSEYWRRVFVVASTVEIAQAAAGMTKSPRRPPPNRLLRERRAGAGRTRAASRQPATMPVVRSLTRVRPKVAMQHGGAAPVARQTDELRLFGHVPADHDQHAGQRGQRHEAGQGRGDEHEEQQEYRVHHARERADPRRRGYWSRCGRSCR